MRAIKAQERQFRDNLMQSRVWLDVFRYSSEPDRLPPEMAVIVWFNIGFFDFGIDRASGRSRSSSSDQIRKRMQARQLPRVRQY